MSLCRTVATLAAACLVAGCGGGSDEGEPAVRRMAVGQGVTLPYVDQGRGEPVVFVHGALGDLRTLERPRALVSQHYRAIGYTQRYFGTDTWDPSWPGFGTRVHADDLVAFLRGLGAGPAHLVAWSYAGHVALTVAREHPDLVRSLLVYEPGATTFLDAAELAEWQADTFPWFGPIFQAVLEQGNDALGVRLLIDGSGNRDGYFDVQPEARRQIELDNARTMPLLLTQTAPPDLRCADLGAIRVPVVVGMGEHTRPAFSVVSRAAMRCLPGQPHFVVRDRNHMWPEEDPDGFARAVLGHLAIQ
jgi:pimeloyl-ACP methyl ester carboxylesterase